MSDILKHKILSLTVQKYVDDPFYGLHPQTGKEVTRQFSKEYEVTDEGEIVSRSAPAGISMDDWFRSILDTEKNAYLFTPEHLEAKKIAAELTLFPDQKLAAMSERELWSKSIEIAEAKLAKSGRGRAA